ncbi:MAG: molybdopterin molybdotransferase MoeA [Campylobacterales bacterium]|nr:molybdopterin molybdotransferase MoeA [Campylobacterales bacterium]
MSFIHFDESMQILNAIEITNPKKEKIYLMDTLGYVLGEDITASYHSPEFPTSAMDGYAIRYEDQELRELPISSINPAGSDTQEALIGGRCIKTFTGSLMPEGSDTLIPIENVTVEGESIIINEAVPKGFAVREVGENYKDGEVLIGKNTPIDIAHIGVMATLNIVSPWVYAKPTVAILSTGSELLELGEIPTNKAQIRSSNNYILEAMVKKYGGKALQMGCISDDSASISKAMQEALNASDIVVTTGGVSVGDFDFVKDVVRDELGCEVLFQGVRIKPGQHVMVARKGDKFILALPGFAYSATVTALLYLVPLLAAFQKSFSPLKVVKATLKEPFVKRANKTEFSACNCYLEEGRYVVDFEGKKIGSSAILTNMLGNIGLLVTREADSSKEAGELVEVLVLR